MYQNRYVTTEDIVDLERMDEEGNVPITGTMLLVYDFDTLHVRQEKLARLHRLQDANPGMEITDEMLEGEVDGIELHLAEEVHEKVAPLTREITTGANVPYLLARRPMPHGSVPLIDSERILTVDVSCVKSFPGMADPRSATSARTATETARLARFVSCSFRVGSATYMYLLKIFCSTLKQKRGFLK